MNAYEVKHLKQLEELNENLDRLVTAIEAVADRLAPDDVHARPARPRGGSQDWKAQL